VINAALIGLGWWGRHILYTLYNKSNKIRLVKVFDIVPQLDSDFFSDKGIMIASNFDDILNDSAVDVIIIATPHSFHEEQIIAASKAGKHVFCEKPLALTYESAERSVAACDKSGVVLGVGHERRFEPAMQEIARLVRQGELGDIMHVEANFSHDKLANLDSSNWRVSSVESPAAAMTATGIHITDSFVDMFGSIEQVFAMTAIRNSANVNGDVLNVSLRFKSGATGTFNSVLETPLYLRYAVFGSKAWVEVRDYCHPSEQGIADFFFSRAEKEVHKTTFDDVDTVKLNLEAWADAVMGNTEYPITRSQKLENILVFEAICQSVKSGSPINLHARQ